MRPAVAILALWLAAGPAAAQVPAFDPQARVTEALERIRPVAYHRDRLDWTAIEARARALAESARDEVDLMPAYQALVSYLEDNHSQVRYPAGLMERWRERYGSRRMLPDPPPSPPRPTSRFMGRTEPEVRTTPLGSAIAGVIVVPSVRYEPPPSTFAARLHAGVRAVQDQACGYLVDLRGNTGGSVLSMVVGLSDLIGDDRRMAYVRPDGSEMVMTLRGGVLRGRQLRRRGRARPHRTRSGADVRGPDRRGRQRQSGDRPVGRDGPHDHHRPDDGPARADLSRRHPSG